MSMLELGNHRTPKGAITSPTRRAILQHLQMHGERSIEQLNESFKGFTTWRINGRHELPSDMRWLDSHLRHLRAIGHISRRIDDAGQIYWKVGTDVSTGPDDISEPEEAHRGEVVAPRQVNLMHGPVYEPKAFVPARPGAMDYSRFPSLMGGRRVDYRSGS